MDREAVYWNQKPKVKHGFHWMMGDVIVFEREMRWNHLLGMTESRASDISFTNVFKDDEMTIIETVLFETKHMIKITVSIDLIHQIISYSSFTIGSKFWLRRRARWCRRVTIGVDRRRWMRWMSRWRMRVRGRVWWWESVSWKGRRYACRTRIRLEWRFEVWSRRSMMMMRSWTIWFLRTWFLVSVWWRLWGDGRVEVWSLRR